MGTPYCRKCRLVLPKDAVFCYLCGKRAEPLEGENLPAESCLFCTERAVTACGHFYDVSQKEIVYRRVVQDGTCGAYLCREHAIEKENPQHPLPIYRKGHVTLCPSCAAANEKVWTPAPSRGKKSGKRKKGKT